MTLKAYERQQAWLDEQTWLGIVPCPWTFLHKNVNNNHTSSKNKNRENCALVCLD